MPNAITISTVQGIGDIFWVYQKLAPHFDTINLNILCVDMGPVQLRAQAFCKMLPKVGKVTYQKVPAAHYHRVAQTRYALPSGPGPVDYAVNAPLEAGINLRDIDPGMAVEEFVDLGLPSVEKRGDYLCAFVAGAKGPTLWTAARWLHAIKKLAAKMGTREIVLVGADWDRSVQDTICVELLNLEYSVETHVGTMGLADTIGVIRRSRFFIGFQSGLSVLADNYDVPQLMLYFAKLRPMMFTWPKPANIGTRYRAATFADDVDAMIKSLPTEGAS